MSATSAAPARADDGRQQQSCSDRSGGQPPREGHGLILFDRDFCWRQEKSLRLELLRALQSCKRIY